MKYHYVTTPQTMKKRLAEIADCKEVVIDVETVGLVPKTGKLRLITIGVDTHAVVIDFFKVGSDSAPDIQGFLEGKIIYGHNLSFDVRYLFANNIKPVNVRYRDTMLASRILTAGCKGDDGDNDLASIADRHLGVKLSKEEQVSNWNTDHLRKSQVDYAVMDVSYIRELYRILSREVAEIGAMPVLDLEHEILPITCEMSDRGIRVDVDQWEEFARFIDKEMMRCKQELDLLCPPSPGSLFEEINSWNLNSNVDIGKIILQLGYKPPTVVVTDKKTGKRTKKVQDSFGDEVLACIDEPYEAAIFASKLREFRKLRKMKSSYGVQWLRSCIEGMTHPDWKQLGTHTGRFSCTDPNITQIPKRKEFRRLFIPRDGYVMLIADYSQIELRIAAVIANDREIIAEYNGENPDLHSATARAITGKENVSKDDRQTAKAANFGLVFGMHPRELPVYAMAGYQVSMSLDEAIQIDANWKKKFSGIAEWHKRVLHTFRRNPTTRTLLGRPRHNVVKYTEQLNTPVQGTGADGLKMAMVAVAREGREIGMFPVIACHDELICEVPLEHAEQGKKILESCMVREMSRLLQNKIRVEADAVIAMSWADKA